MAALRIDTLGWQVGFSVTLYGIDMLVGFEIVMAVGNVMCNAKARVLEVIFEAIDGYAYDRYGY